MVFTLLALLAVGIAEHYDFFDRLNLFDGCGFFERPEPGHLTCGAK